LEAEQGLFWLLVKNENLTLLLKWLLFFIDSSEVVSNISKRFKIVNGMKNLSLSISFRKRIRISIDTFRLDSTIQSPHCSRTSITPQLPQSVVSDIPFVFKWFFVYFFEFPQTFVH
jgi:hypothetical protein